MTTKRLKFSKIKIATYNPRVSLVPEDPEWKAIAASLDQYGYLGGMVVNTRTMTLVAGHQRMAIMKAKGETAADFSVVDLDEPEEKKLNLIMNKAGGRWDDSRLEELMASMRADGIDLQNLGFSDVEIKDILNASKPDPKQDPDTPTGPVTVPVTKLGDLYELWTGDSDIRHRVLCGDSTSPSDVGKLMDGHKARLVFTDPPFGVSYVSQAGIGNGRIANDDLRGQNLIDFLQSVFERLDEATIPKAAFYCFYASCNHIEFESAMISAGWRVKQQLIWAKQMVLGRADHHWAHEPLLYCVKNGQNCEWLGDRTETTLYAGTQPDPAKMTKEELQTLLTSLLRNSTVWEEKKDTANQLIHSTQKPTSLARRAIRNSSLPGDIIIDCFLGSGSSLVAAELEGRSCHGMELDPCYIDAILQRFEATFQDVHISLNGTPYQ